MTDSSVSPNPTILHSDMNPPTGQPDEFRIIRSMVSKVLPSWMDLDGIAQDIWVECWKNARYITRKLVRYRCIDYLRRQKEQDAFFEEYATQTDVETLASHELLNEIIRLANLTPTEKLILHNYSSTRSIAEIAAHVGLSPSVCYNTLTRLLARLRTLAAEQFQRED